jgi:hypothetical protein
VINLKSLQGERYGSSCRFLVLPEVLEDDDFLLVSSAMILVNISGTVKAIDLRISHVKDMGLLV